MTCICFAYKMKEKAVSRKERAINMTVEELNGKLESVMASRKAMEDLYSALGKLYYQGAEAEELQEAVQCIRSLEASVEFLMKDIADQTEPAPVKEPAPPETDVQLDVSEVIPTFDPEMKAPEAVQETAPGLTCAVCGAALKEGDRFCLECGTRVRPAEVPAAEKASEPEPEAAEKSEIVEEKPVPTGPVCASCGASLQEGDRFCMECGTRVQAPAAPVIEEPAAPQKLTCRTCGKELEEGMRFCIYCGARVEEPARRVCPACGAVASQQDFFCGECGQRLG